MQDSGNLSRDLCHGKRQRFTVLWLSRVICSREILVAKIFVIKPTWHGPDRRIIERRCIDRRAEIRYEPTREDRRSGVDRREHERSFDGYRLARRLRRYLNSCSSPDDRK